MDAKWNKTAWGLLSWTFLWLEGEKIGNKLRKKNKRTKEKWRNIINKKILDVYFKIVVTIQRYGFQSMCEAQILSNCNLIFRVFHFVQYGTSGTDFTLFKFFYGVQILLYTSFLWCVKAALAVYKFSLVRQSCTSFQGAKHKFFQGI